MQCIWGRYRLYNWWRLSSSQHVIGVTVRESNSGPWLENLGCNISYRLTGVPAIWAVTKRVCTLYTHLHYFLNNQPGSHCSRRVPVESMPCDICRWRPKQTASLAAGESVWSSDFVWLTLLLLLPVHAAAAKMKEMCTSKAKAAITAVFWRSTQRIRLGPSSWWQWHREASLVCRSVCGLACTRGLQLESRQI